MGSSRGPALAGLALLGAACATVSPPPPGVAERARAVSSYSARLKVSLRGPDVRARANVLLAFRRPDALRIELPGPSGARLLAVTRGGSLTAVFPADRAVFESAATPDTLEALLGVSLAPDEVMDLLVGAPSARVGAYKARWGAALPREIEARLADGARLKLAVEEPVTGAALPELAFEPPPHDGYRRVDVGEARRLWSAR
jgi:hypothetical protein